MVEMTYVSQSDAAQQSGHTAPGASPPAVPPPPQQARVLSLGTNSISLSGLATIILFSGFLFLVVLSKGRNVPSNFSLSQYITCYLGAAFDV